MKKYLFISVFFSGFTSLAVEMAASRLLGNYFGTSNLVWACIIGLILIYLTAGYFIGGTWSDKSPNYRTFFQILSWAAFMVGVIPVISRPVLQVSATAFDQLQMGPLIGSFTAVLILFSIPITLLGTTSPFAIRLALTDDQKVGRLSGRVYAISTLGSFIGTFLPVLFLIPMIGTYRTFLAISSLMLVVSLLGLWLSSSWKAVLPFAWMPFVLIGLTILGTKGSDKRSTGQVYETESAYNYIQVLQQDGLTKLRLNEGQGDHSVYNPDVLNYSGPWGQVLAAPFFNTSPIEPESVRSMAIVGLAAGTTARMANAVFENIVIDGFEIDPKIVEVGRRFFDMTQPNLNVVVEDGRVGLAKSTKRYQVISVDAYRPPYIPWHLTTREFFQIVSDHLDVEGVMAINIGRAPNDRRLISMLGSTIASVFPSVYVMDVPGTFNSVVFATKKPTDSGNLSANLLYLAEKGGVHPLLLETLQITVANMQPSPQPSVIFTDDNAPIEWVTNDMVIRFLVSGNLEKMQ